MTIGKALVRLALMQRDEKEAGHTGDAIALAMAIDSLNRLADARRAIPQGVMRPLTGETAQGG